MRHCKRRGNGRPPQHSISSMPRGQVSRAPTPRAFAGMVSGKRAISGLRKRSHQNTPLAITALPTETVTVTDPTHPLFGRTFPLVGVTTKQRLGRVCVVWLYPGVERVIPVAATTLAEPSPPRSPCKLSVAGLHTLLAVVASLVDPLQEDAHGKAVRSPEPSQPTTAISMVGTALPSTHALARRSPCAPCPAVDEPFPHDPQPRAHYPLPDPRGGAQ